MRIEYKRASWILLLVIGVGASVALALLAFQKNLLFFFSPSQIAEGQAPKDYAFRVGGLVEKGSVQRDAESLKVQFVLTDQKASVTVTYTGILPDLFREGQGVVALGRLNDKGAFEAEEVLAKHDENYMPPDVAATLKEGAPTALPTLQK